MNDTIIAGDTLDFTVSVDAYPATDGWTLKYRLTPRFTTPAQAPIVLTASAVGPDYQIQVAPATTAAWMPGNYAWARWVEKVGARQSLEEGQPLIIRADPATTAQGYDGRSQAAKAVDDLEAAMATFHSTGGRVKSYAIGSRQMEFESMQEIQNLLTFWRNKLTTEEANARLASGLPGSPRLLARL